MKKFLGILAICCFLILSAFRFVETPTAPMKEIHAQDSSVISPLVMYGAYLFQREHCGNCHSGWSYNMVSLAGNAGKYTNAWHYRHLEAPTSISPYSNMPAYPHLLTQEIDLKVLAELIEKERKRGISLPEGFEQTAATQLSAEAGKIAKALEEAEIKQEDITQKEVVAMIAYLQKL